MENCVLIRRYMKSRQGKHVDKKFCFPKKRTEIGNDRFGNPY